MEKARSTIFKTTINRDVIIFNYLGFLIWPFGVLLNSFKYWKQSWSKNVFWIFCIFFGLTFVIAEGDIGSADSARYAEALIEYHNSGTNLKELLNSFYSDSSSGVDIVQPLITFIVSLFTVNPHILFAVFGLVFGFFHSRNIWFILNKIKDSPDLVTLLYIIAFVLLNPIWNINGFRMWTGAQVFLYGALPFLIEKKNKMIIWSLTSVFFHFSFIMPVIILFVFVLFKERINIYFGFFIITSFLKEIDLQAVQSLLLFLPPMFHTRVMGYTNLDYAESLESAMAALNWYVTFSIKGLAWAIYIIVIFAYIFLKEAIYERKELKSLFSFALLFYGFANILSFIPSGDRFLNVASSLMFAFFILLLTSINYHQGLKLVRIVTIPFLLLFCLMMIRSGMDFYGLTTIIGNPIFAIIGIKSHPLIMEIKALI